MYMVPNYYIKIEEIPLTNNGKLDRRGLPEPRKEDIIREQYIAPENETEEKICRIFSGVLGYPENEIGRMCDFFEFGGDSLNAIQIISKIKTVFNVKITIKQLMNNSKIISLAELIMENEKLNITNKEIKNYNNNEYPITTLLSGLAYNNINITFEDLKNSKDSMLQFYKINGTLDITKLEKAFNEIIERHSVLRTNFIEKEVNNQKQIFGQIRDQITLKIERYTVDDFETFIRPFDITNELLIRVGMIDNLILMIDMDHKVADGYSFGILMNELIKLYNDEKLEDLPIQYSDYAIDFDNRLKMDEFKDQLEYYRNLFKDNKCDNLSLMEKSSENTDVSNKYDSISIKTSEDTYNIINKISNNYNISKTAYFLTMYSLMLSLYSGKQDIFTSINSSNRSNINTDKIIGMFVKYMPILVKVENNMNLIDLIKNTMDTLLTVYDYDIPYSMVSEELNLPECNSWFKFDPYRMINVEASTEIIENIDQNNLHELLNKNGEHKKNIKEE